MDYVEWSKYRGLGHLDTFWDIFSPRNHIAALLSSNLVILVHSRYLLFRTSSMKFRRGSFLEESLPVITLGAVDILGSEPILSFSLSPKEDEDKY